MKDITRKYTRYIVFGIFLLVLAISGVSYAYFGNSRTQSSTNNMASLSCLDLSFTSNNASVNLAHMYPMTDKQGLNTTPYSFTVANNCSSYVEYYIIFTAFNNDNNLLNPSYVKISTNTTGGTPSVLGNLEHYDAPASVAGDNTVFQSYILDKGFFNGNESVTHNYRMWLDGDNEDSWIDEIDTKVLSGKLSIVGVVKQVGKDFDFNIATSVNGTSYSGIPTGGYLPVTPSGTEWDYRTNGLKITNYSGATTYRINYNAIATPTYLNAYVKSLADNSATTGVYNEVEDSGTPNYRYEGKNPNNYVWFNNEMWRIIGAFGSNTTGIKDTELVKIIRNDSLGYYYRAVDSSLYVAWEKTPLNEVLNDYYLNGTDATESVKCFKAYTTYVAPCSFVTSGITDAHYRQMIQTNSLWHTGLSNGTTAKTMYKAERSGEGYLGDGPTYRSPISLMYASDYLYGAPATDCPRTTQLYSYGTSTPSCINNNWIFSFDELTMAMNPSEEGFKVSHLKICDDGGPCTAENDMGAQVRPVLYLNKNVYKISGTGSQSDPYIIGI